VGERVREVALALHRGGAHALRHAGGRREREPRQHGVALGAEVAPPDREALAAPDLLHGDECLVRELVAFGEVGAERGELGLEVARREPDDDAPPGEHVEGGDRLGREEGVPVGGDEHVRLDAEPGGRRRDEREGDEGVEGLVAAAREPTVFGRGVVRHERRVEAGHLGGPGHLGNGLCGDEFFAPGDAVRRQLHREAHRQATIARVSEGKGPTLF
jgi:hypothetical protein